MELASYYRYKYSNIYDILGQQVHESKREMVRYLETYMCIYVRENERRCTEKITSQELEGNISRLDFDSTVGVFQHRMAHRFCCIGRRG